MQSHFSFSPELATASSFAALERLKKMARTGLEGNEDEQV